MALTTRSDGSDEHAITDVVTRNSVAELFDDADRLVTNDQTRSNWILASDDVQVCAANSRERYADDGFARAGAWFWDLLNTNLVLCMKNVCLHLECLPFEPPGCFNLAPQKYPRPFPRDDVSQSI